MKPRGKGPRIKKKGRARPPVPGEKRSAPSKGFKILIGLLLIGALLRIVYLIQFNANTPYFDSPLVDAKMYDQLAQQIAAGAWIGQDIYYQSPFYAYILGLLFTIGGHSYLLVYIVQALLGLVGLLLIFLVGKRVFNETVALIAVALALLYGPFLFYESKLLMTTVATSLNLLVLMWFLKTMDSPSSLKWFFGGLLAGLSILVRGNMIFFVPFVFIWLYMIGGKNRVLFIRRAGAVLIGILLTIAPVTLRNYLVGQDFVPISGHTGITFYMGNSPEATGTYTAVEGISGVILLQQEEERRIAEEALGVPLKSSEITSYWYKKGLTYIVSHPLPYLRLELKKALLFFNTLELANNYNYYLERRLVPVLWIMFLPFALISSLGIIGIIVGARKNNATVLLTFYAVSNLITQLVFYVLSRLRLPVVPVLILFASFGGYWIWRSIQKGQTRRYAIALASVGLILIISAYPVQEKDRMLGGSYAKLGNIYAEKKMFQPALRAYHQALKLDPSLATVYNNMGNVYFTLNQLDQAQAAYTKAVELDSTHRGASFNLAMVSKKRGSFQQAVTILQQVTKTNPAYAEAHYELGNGYRQLKRYDEAIDSYRRAIELQPSLAEAYNNLGIVYLNMGRREEALREWRRTLQASPNSEAARTAQSNIRAIEEMAKSSTRENEEKRQ